MSPLGLPYEEGKDKKNPHPGKTMIEEIKFIA